LRFGLAAVFFALLMQTQPRAFSQCADIAGSWNATETGTLTLAISASDGETGSNTYPVSGSGVVKIAKTGTCTYQYSPILPSDGSLLNSGLTPAELATLVRTVKVSGDSVTETGIFAVINYAAAESEGLTITSVTGNVETGTGQVSPGANPPTMTLHETADMAIKGSLTSNGTTYTFTLTVTSSTTATFDEIPPIEITPPSQTGVASGLAYKGLFTATGGSGGPYSWCVLSGPAGSACLPSGSGAPLPDGFSLNAETGLLISTGSPAAEQGSYPLTIQATDSDGDKQPLDFTLVIGCPVTVNLSWELLEPQMQASFTPADGKTLAAAAKACGYVGFDWVQQITQEGPTVIYQANGTPLTPPFHDPPPGGYKNVSKGLSQKPPFLDAYPYYYNPSDIEAAPFETGNTLNFLDAPSDQCFPGGAAWTADWNGCKGSSSFIGLTTQLVGICDAESSTCDSSGPSAPLFQWSWKSDYNGLVPGPGGGVFDVQTISLVPPGPGNGGVGVGLTSINGIPAPGVTVTPAETKITTAQSLSVGITVQGASGTQPPTGSIKLTSGSYSSAATALSEGAATIVIPAGRLAAGSDTQRARYTPDNESATSFSFSSGTALVTVSLALPMPAVKVTPSSTSILSAQPLPVTVDVSAASGKPTPTGTVTLSSGSYFSIATSLAHGAAAIVVPANSLAAGSDAITADYAPDAASSKTYDSSTGISAPVTVKLSPAAAKPAISPGSGVYATAQLAKISDSTPGTIIYYTTDESTPTTDSTVYSGPISVSSSETVLAIAAGNGYSDSATATGAFTIAPPAGSGPLEWTWMGGSSAVPADCSQSESCGQPGVYGPRGKPGAGYVVGARDGAASWTDNKGNLWIFGGSGFDSVGAQGELNDLWEFNPTSGEWTWMAGNSALPVQTGESGEYLGQPGSYGELGTPSSANGPGGRDSAVTWTDGEGNFWLFGGEGFDGYGTYGNLNDLWEFSPATNQWVWMGGNSSAGQSGGQPGVYGTLGMPAATNVPGGRQSAIGWLDQSGDLWLFGGLGYDEFDVLSYLNDLWEFNPATLEWTWMGGSSQDHFTSACRSEGNNLICGQAGVYGTQGKPAAANIPGSRYGSVSWTDGNGNLWLFGGFTFDASGNYGDLNDLWEFNPASKEWTWEGGSNSEYVSTNQYGTPVGVYGTEGVPAAGNWPGGRESGFGWTEKSGSFWMFGGYGWDAISEIGPMNDLWEFNPATRLWSWMGGDSTDGPYGPQPGVYGTLGTPSAANTPGARTGTTGWADANSNLWLFGGYGFDSSISGGYTLNDLWRFQTLSPAPTVATPTLSVAGGTYASAQTVKISDSTPGATIYCTLDGSTPSGSSNRYTTALSIAKDTTVKAIAEIAGDLNSAVATATYTILKTQTITFAQPATPVTYGVKPIALSATASSGLAVTFKLISGPAKLSGHTLTITGAGWVVVAATQAGNGVFAAAAEVKRTLKVDRATLTVTANNLSMKQGAAVPTLTYRFVGFVNGDTATSATTGKPALSTTATSKSAAGTYPITVKAGTLASENYKFEFVNGTLTVTQ